MPTIPIHNLYHMLTYAWTDLASFDLHDLDADEHAHAAGALGGLLVRVMQRIVRQGLDRDYRRLGLDTRQPRGRIDVNATVRRMLRPTGQLHCEIDERVVDFPAHRAIKAALRALAENAAIEAHVRGPACDLLRKFGEVQSQPLTRALVARAREQNHHRRLQLPLHFCKMLADILLPDPSEGAVSILDIRRDDKVLRKIFETFVRRFCQLHFKRTIAVNRHALPWHGLAGPDSQHVPTLIPDVVVQKNMHFHVIECKFTPTVLVRNQQGPLRFRPDHLRQLATYVQNLQRHRPTAQVAGLLLYAQGLTQIDERFRLWNHDMRVATLNLNAPWPDIESRLIELAS